MNILSDIAERLNAKTIHEVRVIARAVGAHSESSQKSSVIDAILAVAANKVLPQPPSKRGAPPKSDNADAVLVADIKTCREFYAALKSDEGSRVLTVADSGAGRKFSELTHIYPEKRIKLSGNTAARMIDFFTPVFLGQRMFILGGGNVGKTALLKSVANSVKEEFKDIKLIFLLLNSRPEEVTDFRRTFKNDEIFAATFDKAAAIMSSEAMLAFDSAKKKVEDGLNAIIFVDGLFDGNVALETVKKLLYCVCNAEEGGSLTAISTLPENYDYCSDILNTANAVIALSKEFMKQKIFPAIDVKKCFLDREEILLSKQELTAIRRVCDSLTAEQIIELFTNTNNNEEIIEKYKNG